MHNRNLIELKALNVEDIVGATECFIFLGLGLDGWFSWDAHYTTLKSKLCIFYLVVTAWFLS